MSLQKKIKSKKDFCGFQKGLIEKEVAHVILINIKYISSFILNAANIYNIIID